MGLNHKRLAGGYGCTWDTMRYISARHTHPHFRSRIGGNAPEYPMTDMGGGRCDRVRLSARLVNTSAELAPKTKPGLEMGSKVEWYAKYRPGHGSHTAGVLQGVRLASERNGMRCCPEGWRYSLNGCENAYCEADC